MSNPNNCPQCGAELPKDAPESLCPACLLQNGFASEPGPAPDSETMAKGSNPNVGPMEITSEIKRLFPNLEILECLGQGGMGVVYKARQKQLDRFIALKVMKANAAKDPAFAERFTREARALAKLSHPNIVSVFDFGQAEGSFYLIMEYMDGANLRQVIRSKSMQPKEALQVVPKICEALQYAHDQGIVHRDIKPENILLDKQGRVKIADFGLAKLVKPGEQDFTLTQDGMTMGTPRYMAPEQIDNPQEVDHRADIYSLGVVFYEVLTGEVPMGRFAPPSKKVEIDVRLDEVVLRSLEREPNLRYQHASDVRTQLDNIAFTPATAAGVVQGAKGAALTEAQIRRCVQAPAEALMLIAGTALFVALAVIVWLGMAKITPAQMTRGTLIGMSACLAVYSMVVMTAALLMRRLKARLFCLLIIGIAGIFVPLGIAYNVVDQFKHIPQWPVVIPLWLGIPVAFWALKVLFKTDVREAFGRPAANGSPDQAGTAGSINSSSKGITVIVVAVLIIAVLSGATALFHRASNPGQSYSGQNTPLPERSKLPGQVYLGGHTSVPRAIAVSADGKTLASAGLDGRLLIRRLPGGDIRFSIEPVTKNETQSDAALHCVAVSMDGRHVFAAGNAPQIVRVDTQTGVMEKIPVPNTGAISALFPYDNGRIAYVVDGNEIVFFNLAQERMDAKAAIYPGKEFGNVESVASSPDGRYIAVSSSNMVPNNQGGANSAEPCKLTVFDTNGIEKLSWQFPDYADFAWGQLAFADSRTLVVVLPSGQMLKWRLDQSDEWRSDAEPVRIIPGRYSSATASQDGKSVWLSLNRQVLNRDIATGKILSWAELKIGEKIANFSADPIEAIATVPNRNLVALALWDGRIALVEPQPMK